MWVYATVATNFVNILEYRVYTKNSFISSSYKIKIYCNILTKLVATVCVIPYETVWVYGTVATNFVNILEYRVFTKTLLHFK
jgi:hypothetical protein